MVSLVARGMRNSMPIVHSIMAKIANNTLKYSEPTVDDTNA